MRFNKMDTKEYNKRLRDILLPNGFAHKGNAYFRVNGDGVFQVIKREYNPRVQEHRLLFGLFSMYGELQQIWFTSRGCVPNYNAMDLVDHLYDRVNVMVGNRCLGYFQGHIFVKTTPANFYASEHTRDELQKAMAAAVSEIDHRNDPAFQLSEFETKGIPAINKISTQELLCDAMFTYAKSKMEYNVIFPLLYIGRKDEAVEILQMYIDQNISAYNLKKERGSVEYELKDDPNYVKKIELRDYILSSTYAEIVKYLWQNYLRNISYYQQAIGL